ncbi:adenosylcobinamide kinase /adenosylcobinamide-phosphate guanylyltransferase [Microlunatus soli]|uniref:Adenosylcobinamide kinase n=2 Tax=Microlunatus soli TaxID=630515 RepID=A0A1H1ZH20_9ACTN|nr:adenosylcobinamide kinase /adenosylcobinamide-phosphate guanylyltransferase [Microlunatus soli]
MLITGGVRSGKSWYAEQAATAAAVDGRVSYVAPGPAPDPVADPDWAARVDAHRRRRPAGWTTIEGSDLAGAIGGGDGPVLIDCLGTWVTAVIDELGTWETPLSEWKPDFDDRLAAVREAWRRTDRTLIAVSNEVGWGVVPAYRSGRIFADLLGEVNRTIAAVSDRVVLMVAGRPLIIPAEPDDGGLDDHGSTR